MLRTITVTFCLLFLLSSPARSDEPAPNRDKLPAGAIARLSPTAQSFNKSLVYSSDGRAIWFTTRDGLQRWKLDGVVALSANQQHFRHILAINSLRGIGLHRAKDQAVCFDVRTGRAIATAVPLKGLDADFSQDGRRVIIPGNNFVELWDIDDGKLLVKIPSAWFQPKCAVHPDGDTVLLMGRGQRFEQWSISGQQMLNSIDYERPGRSRGAKDFVISPDGRRLAVMDGSNAFDLIDLRNRTVVLHNDGEYRNAHNGKIAYSPDGRLLVALFNDPRATTLQIWNVHRLQKLIETEWPEDANRFCMTFSPDGSQLATWGEFILIWDMSRYRPNAGPLSEAGAKQATVDLRGEAPQALKGVSAFAESGESAVPILRRLVQFPNPPPAARIHKLLANLDDTSFDKREAASKELNKLGLDALQAVREFLAGSPSPEARLRAERIRAGCERELERYDRILETLEAIGGADAKSLMTEIGKHFPGTQLARDAEAGIRRLELRGK